LSVILSSTELLEIQGEDLHADRKAEHLRRIRSSVLHLNDLLNDVLLANKAEAGMLSVHIEEFDLVAITQELIADQSLGNKSHNPIMLSVSGQARSVKADRKLMRILIQNLVSNACKYSPGGSRVDVALGFGLDSFTVQVADRGIGIPADELPRLFEMFHRARNARHIAGTGLGLSIVKTVATLHGASVKVKSKEGVGTTVTIEARYAGEMDLARAGLTPGPLNVMEGAIA
jgi:signal transduction histidine kinase